MIWMILWVVLAFGYWSCCRVAAREDERSEMK